MSHSRRAFTPTSPAKNMRSEEHTSELQSHLNLVCRLLLEKKKKIEKYSMVFPSSTSGDSACPDTIVHNLFAQSSHRRTAPNVVYMCICNTLSTAHDPYSTL